MLRALMTLISCAALASAQETHFELRASLIFDGMMTGLGEEVDSSALPRGLGRRCGLNFGVAHTEVEPALIALSEAYHIAAPAQTEWVLSAVLRLGRALRSFASTCTRCRLAAGANRLSRHATRLVQLNSSSIGPRDGHFPVVRMDGVDVSEYLVRAAHAFQSERYLQAGLTLASLLIHTSSYSDEDADEPIGNDHTFAGFDAYGKLLREEDAKEHLRKQRAERLALLEQKIDALANAPKPKFEEIPREDDDYRSECCCCWAKPADNGERSAHSAHLR